MPTTTTAEGGLNGEVIVRPDHGEVYYKIKKS
jgi:hypothetical protein